MRENESGDCPNAQKRAAEAEVLLREAELIAIKGGILNEARALIAQADEAKVASFAPRTLQAAKRHLAEAEQEIQRNRYDVTSPRKLAAQARYDARHATYLAQQIERVLQEEKDDQAGIEALILSWEEPLQAHRLRHGAGYCASTKGMQAPMKEINEYAEQQAQEVRRLKQELGDRDDQLAALNNQLQRLESRLGGESQERISLQRRVDAQARLRRTRCVGSFVHCRRSARVSARRRCRGVAAGHQLPVRAAAPSMRSSAALMKKGAAGAGAVSRRVDLGGRSHRRERQRLDQSDPVAGPRRRGEPVPGEQFRRRPGEGQLGRLRRSPAGRDQRDRAGRTRNRRIDLVIHCGQRLIRLFERRVQRAHDRAHACDHGRAPRSARN